MESSPSSHVSPELRVRIKNKMIGGRVRGGRACGDKRGGCIRWSESAVYDEKRNKNERGARHYMMER